MGTTIIVAVSRNNCIGKDNDLPWKQKADLKFFKEVTTGNAVIMGRKTFESMGNKPLPNRLNMVISKSLPPRVEGILVVRDIEEALEVCKKHKFVPYIIGGGSIFSQHLEIANTIFMTVIDTEIVEGDVFFPKLNYHEWNQEVVQTGEADEKNDHKFTIYKLTRKKPYKLCK